MFFIHLGNFYTIRSFLCLLVFIASSCDLLSMNDSDEDSGDSATSHSAPLKKRIRRGEHEYEYPFTEENKPFFDFESRSRYAPVSVVDVGRVFLQFAKDSNDSSMGKMKLHKLCYYAQGYFSAYFNTPLYGEDTCAEEHGAFEPALKLIYGECAVDSDWSGSLTYAKNVDLGAYNPEVIVHLRKIYNIKGGFTGLQLRNQTHKERPWMEYYKGQRVIMKKDILRDFFSSPEQITIFLKESLKEEHLKKSPLEELRNQIFRIKNFLKRTHEVEKIIGFNDELLSVVESVPLEQLRNLSAEIDDLVDWNIEHARKPIVGYLFFPSELIEGNIPLPILFLNLSLHWKLAYSARYGHPLGQFYFSKLLQYFEIFDEKRASFSNMSHDQFERISSGSYHPYLQGLAFKHIDNETESFSKFTEGCESQHAPSAYELAKIMDRRGDDGVLDVYKKTTSLGYPLAFLGQGNYEETDDERLTCFKAAGERGIGEGYYQIGKMIEEGFAVPESEEYKTAKDWFVMAAQTDSPNAILKLAQDSEEEGNDEEALYYYRALSQLGNIKGYLEEGRILENHELHEEAREVYKKASWMGLYEVAKLETSSIAVSTKEAADKLFKNHFERLVKIAEGEEEDEDD